MSKDKDNLDENLKEDYGYPELDDQDIQYKIYKKREFYYHKSPERPLLKNYDEIKEYRDGICARNFSLNEHQSLLANYINPDTPFRGILGFHGLGTGKCISKDMQVLLIKDVTNIFNNNINLGYYENIAKIWNNYHTILIYDNTNGEWSIPKEDLFVSSMTDNNKIIIKKVSKLYRENVTTQLKRIELENGMKIEITKIHKLYTENGWTNELKVNENIAIPSSIHNRDKESSTDILWSKIKSITYFDYDDYVYDLEVEDTHNYVANGIICHNTCTGVAIAEKFKSMVQKYNTKIHILVPGPLIRESWKEHLIKCTNETYLKYQDKSVYIDEEEKERQRRMAINNALQYYKFMSYRSFQKKVLGERIVERKEEVDGKTRVSYRKTEEGEFERDIAIDRLYNLNNTLLIVDEAHNLTGNSFGEALKYIIKNSINLKVVLFTATPMKNRADDIIELLNFLRPHDSPIERDKLFTGDKSYTLELKPGGLEYFKRMSSGYVSHVRGGDPLTFAKRVDKGEKPEEMKTTKLIRCKMEKLQQDTYDIAVTKEKDEGQEEEEEEDKDALDRKSQAVANFVFPGLSQDKKNIVGYFGREGIETLKNQVRANFELLNKKIAEQVIKNKDETDLVYLTEDGKKITGRIMNKKYLKLFSVKFHKALNKLERLYNGKKGARTAFIYSNLVKSGIEIFEQILLQNGYLEYNEEENYNIKPSTKCYFCGKEYDEHKNQKGGKLEDSESDKKMVKDGSSEYEQIKSDDKHEFAPATFITITGKAGDEAEEAMPEEQKKILEQVFNKVDNVEGKKIKFVLGSRVMNEGISLYNVGEVHILDAHFNFAKVDQVIGRAIRFCSHYAIMNEDYRFPYVNVYKYVVSLNKGLSTEEELYYKAEKKYIMVKKLERAMKEVAVDCPLNKNLNMFQEEIEMHKNCGKDGKQCPMECDYDDCEFKCENKKLNTEYYDPSRKIYRKLDKKEIDMSTFTNALARTEIDFAKKKIKEMYLKKYVYTIYNILEYVKKHYHEDDDEKRDLFDEFFVYKALDELIPLDQNDFNNYTDTIIDKFNRQGYLIYINKYYIFQPFNQNEDVPMYYRTTFEKPQMQQLSLFNYLQNTDKYKEYRALKQQSLEGDTDIVSVYIWDQEVMEYYENRNENKYVGIIDKEVSRRKAKKLEEIEDVFKIREKRPKLVDKKRATGLQNIFGSVCATSKSKEYLEKMAKDMSVKTDEKGARTIICDKVKEKLLELEKYATGKDKMTYIMVPKNHPLYEFPYNLEDRKDYIVGKVKDNIPIKIDIDIKKNKGEFILTIKDNEKIKEYHKLLETYKFKKVKNEFILEIK